MAYRTNDKDALIEAKDKEIAQLKEKLGESKKTKEEPKPKKDRRIGWSTLGVLVMIFTLPIIGVMGIIGTCGSKEDGPIINAIIGIALLIAGILSIWHFWIVVLTAAVIIVVAVIIVSIDRMDDLIQKDVHPFVSFNKRD